jgi:acyl phosphate:glycerol-3-phosphate acyltransferase
MSLYLIPEIILAYLIGSIPSAVWVGKLFYGIDVRRQGSGNAGATNVIRVLGYKAGIPVLLFDVFKGWVAVEIGRFFPHAGLSQDGFTYLSIVLAVAAVTGHIFPVFAGFRGGKGVAVLTGVGIALYPVALVITIGIFALTLILSHYVSLSSIIAAIVFPFIVIFLLGETNPGMISLAVLVGIFIPVSHRKNIQRLFHGTENKFNFKRKEIGDRSAMK